MGLVKSNINKTEELLVNLFVVLLFIVINPIYALFFCGFLNLISPRINFWIFSFMFTLSFTLMFFLKDYSLYLYNPSGNSDVAYYITYFQRISEISWLEIFPRFITRPSGNEPFYWIYVKIVSVLSFGNGSLFVFSYFYLSFLLIAYMGKLIHGNKFVIVIIFILFLNYMAFTNMFFLWRQTAGIFIFLLGILLFDTRENKWFPRIIIYSSALFHLSMAPIIVFFEFFSRTYKGSSKFESSKLHFKDMIVYLVIMAITFIFFSEDILVSIVSPFGLSEKMAYHYLEVVQTSLFSRAHFNWFTFLILLSLWLGRKKLSHIDIFIVSQYFMVIILMTQLRIPDIFSRFTQYTAIASTLIIGRIGADNRKFGFMLLMFMFIRFSYRSQFDTFFVQNYIAHHLSSEWTNPIYGLARMILNYDTLLYFNF